jgi:hypothetical protein
VPHEGHAFERAALVPAAVEAAAVLLAHHPVVADEAGHDHVVDRPLGEERERLGAVAL